MKPFGTVCLGTILLFINAVHGEIRNWQTGEVIPGTSSITPEPGVDLRYWNRETKNLRYADLSGGLNLSNGMFNSSWLDCAHFAGANLTNADLRYTILTDADLTGANLTNAWISGATLTGTNLSGANLTSAYCGYSTWTNAELSGAIVANADFRVATGFTQEQIYSTASYQIGDLRGIILWDNDMSGWNFTNQNLTRAGFRFATLANADLSGANLIQVDFILATLTNANLRGANLANASLGLSTLTDADMSGATVTAVDFRSVTGLTKEQFYSTSTYQSGDLHGINIGGNDLTGWSFVDKNLTNVSFTSSTLSGADLRNAIVTEVDFSSTIGFSQEQLYSTVNYQTGDLRGIGFGKNDLTDWNFRGKSLTRSVFDSAILINTNFSGASLDHADFSYATLANADMSGANLTYANFRSATLTGTDLSGANVANAFFGSAAGFTKEQLYTTGSYQSGDLRGIRLLDNDVSGWNFSNQNLSGADFYRATLTGAQFSGATVAKTRFSYAAGFTKEQLYSTASYLVGDLHGIGLRNNNLSGWNFANQILTGADFYNSNLANADLTGAIIAEANFGRSLYQYSGLSQEQMYSTASYQAGDLQGIKMQRCDLSGWDFANQNLKRADFSYSTLTSADMSGANLAKAILDSTKLNYADLTEANLTGTDLRGSQLLNANLIGANLTDSDLRGATLTGADLSGADMRGSIGLNWSGVSARNTILPYGYINGLDLTAGEVLRIRDYNGGIGVTIRTGMEMTMDAVLNIVFTDATWGSTIMVEAGVPVNLGGILMLNFDHGANLEALVGTTYKLFDWNGNLMVGNCFNEVVSLSGYQWDMGQLYTTGEVTLLAIPEPISLVLLGLGWMYCKKRTV